jgi:hypothetical protein
MIVHEYEEPIVWIRSKNFVLSPGAPIPILTHPQNDWTIPALTKHGLSYKIVFNTADNYARFAAAKAGIGLTAVPKRSIPPDLVIAKEYYLPPLPPVRTLVCERPGLDPQRASALVKHLCTTLFKASAAPAAKAKTSSSWIATPPDCLFGESRSRRDRVSTLLVLTVTVRLSRARTVRRRDRSGRDLAFDPANFFVLAAQAPEGLLAISNFRCGNHVHFAPRAQRAA